MFINCIHCRALVATHPATGAPPEHCPRCDGVLRQPHLPQAPIPIDLAAAPEPIPAAAPTPTISSLLSPREAPRAPAPTMPRARHESGAATEPGPAAAAAAEAAAAKPPPSVRAAAPGDRSEQTRPAASTVDAPIVHDADVADTISTSSAPAPVATTPPSAPATGDDGVPPMLVAQRRAPPATRWRRIAPMAAIGLLSLLLALQVLLADRARLAADPQWRPLVATLCGALGCALPAWHEPRAITLVTRDVRPDPQRPGVLQVNATFRNDARWAQDWPRLQLALSDLDGRIVAARVFAPDEYLDTPGATAELASGQVAALRIDVLEPAATTVSYAFDFL